MSSSTIGHIEAVFNIFLCDYNDKRYKQGACFVNFCCNSVFIVFVFNIKLEKIVCDKNAYHESLHNYVHNGSTKSPQVVVIMIRALVVIASTTSYIFFLVIL